MHSDSMMPTTLKYESDQMMNVWQHFLTGAPALSHIDVYRHDLVDIVRQALSDMIATTYMRLEKDFPDASVPGSVIVSYCERLLQLIADMDLILGTNRNYLLGTWLSKAKFMAQSPEEEEYYEYQARNQITRWGENNGNALNDYASKQWAGLVGTYYYERWQIFLTQVMQSAQTRPSKLDFKHITERTERFEIEWQLKRNEYPTTTRFDTMQVAHVLYEKYSQDQNAKIAIYS